MLFWKLNIVEYLEFKKLERMSKLSETKKVTPCWFPESWTRHLKVAAKKPDISRATQSTQPKNFYSKGKTGQDDGDEQDKLVLLRIK